MRFVLSTKMEVPDWKTIVKWIENALPRKPAGRPWRITMPENISGNGVPMKRSSTQSHAAELGISNQYLKRLVYKRPPHTF